MDNALQYNITHSSVIPPKAYFKARRQISDSEFDANSGNFVSSKETVPTLMKVFDKTALHQIQMLVDHVYGQFAFHYDRAHEEKLSQNPNVK